MEADPNDERWHEIDAIFAGALVVDPAGAEPPEDERLIVISQYFSEEENDFPLKLFFNGLSWPHTERFRYAVGDTVRWRVLNVTDFYPTSGLPPAIQRVAFGVGEVTDEALGAAIERGIGAD